MISILALYLFCNFVGFSSQLTHTYSSIHEIKQISIQHGIIDADNDATDLNHPVVLFKLVSKFYRFVQCTFNTIFALNLQYKIQTVSKVQR